MAQDLLPALGFSNQGMRGKSVASLDSVIIGTWDHWDRNSPRSFPIQVEYAISEMLLCKSVFNFGIFEILECLHIHNGINWRQDPSLNTKFINVSYATGTYQLEGNFHNIFVAFIFQLWHETWGQVWSFLHVLCWWLKKLWILGIFRLCSLGLENPIQII